jgi:hypothetical protein
VTGIGKHAGMGHFGQTFLTIGVHLSTQRFLAFSLSSKIPTPAFFPGKYIFKLHLFIYLFIYLFIRNEPR